MNLLLVFTFVTTIIDFLLNNDYSNYSILKLLFSIIGLLPTLAEIIEDIRLPKFIIKMVIQFTLESCYPGLTRLLDNRRDYLESSSIIGNIRNVEIKWYDKFINFIITRSDDGTIKQENLSLKKVLKNKEELGLIDYLHNKELDYVSDILHPYHQMLFGHCIIVNDTIICLECLFEDFDTFLQKENGRIYPEKSKILNIYGNDYYIMPGYLGVYITLIKVDIEIDVMNNMVDYNTPLFYPDFDINLFDDFYIIEYEGNNFFSPYCHKLTPTEMLKYFLIGEPILFNKEQNNFFLKNLDLIINKDKDENNQNWFNVIIDSMDERHWLWDNNIKNITEFLKDKRILDNNFVKLFVNSLSISDFNCFSAKQKLLNIINNKKEPFIYLNLNKKNEKDKNGLFFIKNTTKNYWVF